MKPCQSTDHDPVIVRDDEIIALLVRFHTYIYIYVYFIENMATVCDVIVSSAQQLACRWTFAINQSINQFMNE